MNVHDSERMLGILKGEGYTPVDNPGEADFILFNTCSIREKAEQKFFSQLGKTKLIKERNPGLKIAVAGCIAEQKGGGIMGRVPHVDYVIGTQNIGRVGELAGSDRTVHTGENDDLAFSELPAERNDSIRAWVNIMYGCNNFCSYCVVPYTRGRERSRPAESILNEVRELASTGYREVTLLGQNVNSYSGEVSFPELLMAMNGISGIERIRFVTSHPKDFSEGLITAMKELEKVCEHIHLPLQSGSDRVLKGMKRGYTYNEYREKVQRLREAVPDVSITSDIIVGFPGEGGEDHELTLAALEETEFDGIFAFKYSPRPMTKAAEMEGHLEEGLKSERLAQVLMRQDRITAERNRALRGSLQEVLVEGESESRPERLTGRTRSNKVVNFHRSERIEPGMIVKMEITEGYMHSLEGILL